MKITKQQLKKIIKEVIKENLDMGERFYDEDTTTEEKIGIVAGELENLQNQIHEKVPKASHKLKDLIEALDDIVEELARGMTK
jgi:N-acetylglutamate synthase/N-acetylornithine aminotransferase